MVSKSEEIKCQISILMAIFTLKSRQIEKPKNTTFHPKFGTSSRGLDNSRKRCSMFKKYLIR